jgi:integrase
MTEVKVHYSSKDRCYFGKFKDPATRKWRTKFVPVSFGTEPEAKQWFSDFLGTLESNQVVPLNTEVQKKLETIATIFPLVEKYWETTKTNKSGTKLDPKTVRDWVIKIRLHVLTHSIANLPLTQKTFTPVAIVDFVEHIKSKSLATYTIKDIRFVLKTFIADARKKGWIDLPFNPVADEIVSSEIPIGAPRSGKDNPIHLSKDETITLITCDAAIIPDWRKVKNLLGLTTGMRDGEIQGLSWEKIDLEKRFVVVDRQLVKGGLRPSFKPPKKGSEREPSPCIT